MNLLFEILNILLCGWLKFLFTFIAFRYLDLLHLGKEFIEKFTPVGRILLYHLVRFVNKNFIVYDKLLFFYLVLLFLDDRDLKTKEKETFLIKNGLWYFEFVSFKLFNSYLPIHHERSLEGKHRG